ncbi:MAG: aldolase/citrate lyase family protein [Synergistaceae bacterium]|nr:aldolase/citrate lyase family protein [Synergistaceae bacterium]
MRRTMLYLPGNNPNMLTRGHLFGSDGLILDLEDAVAMVEKDTARILVSKYLHQGEFGKCEVTVRINGIDTEYWKDDLAAVVPAKRLDGIRAPKVDDAGTVKILDEEISRLEDKNGIPQGKLKLFCLLETAKGIWNAYDIATASPRVAAIIPGGEDLRADLKTERSDDSTELEWARRMLVFAARAAGVDPLDTVFSRVTDDAGLRKETKFIKQLGFAGKSIIHPNQIGIIHDVFNPTEQEIAKAQKIIAAAKEAAARGQGAVSVDGKMVDVPVVKRAEYILVRAGLSEVK